MSLTISRTTRKYPRLPYHDIKCAVLGSRYELSLVFIGSKKARQLNELYRGKQTVPDVLSFPLTKSAGEIYLCLPKIKHSHAQYNHTYEEHVGFLFIHGLLHLKGYQHGATMEQVEMRYARRFIFAGKQNQNDS